MQQALRPNFRGSEERASGWPIRESRNERFVTRDDLQSLIGGKWSSRDGKEFRLVEKKILGANKLRMVALKSKRIKKRRA